MEALKALLDREKMEQITKMLKAVELLAPLIPEFQVKEVEIDDSGTKYIAVLFKKPEGK